MTQRRRSALLYELTRPLPRPRVIIPEGPVSTAAYPNTVEARLIPVHIEPNPNFVPQLLDRFYSFCEQNRDRGNDPDLLASIRVARADCGRRVIRSEAGGVSALTGTVLVSVRRALHDLEQITSLDFGPETFELAIGARASLLWHDDTRETRPDNIGPVRVVWQQKSPQDATRFFQEMDDMAQARTDFNRRAIAFEGVDSVVVKVGFPFFAQLL
jgi:hypothetical protein